MSLCCFASIQRESEDEIIYFNAVGMGIEDLAVVTRAYRAAKERGLGVTVNYWAEQKTQRAEQKTQREALVPHTFLCHNRRIAENI